MEAKFYDCGATKFLSQEHAATLPIITSQRIVMSEQLRRKKLSSTYSQIVQVGSDKRFNVIDENHTTNTKDGTKNDRDILLKKYSLQTVGPSR